ncbi:methionine ABC transporter ATP-binding protein [Undibacter mobilis]|uniref:methionine ABC transporter ATP-binding protein n=1 Tax=Undibacter mobilis TaxID=2292256 RepID=UPI003D30FBF0
MSAVNDTTAPAVQSQQGALAGELIKFDNVRKVFPARGTATEVSALHDVSLSVRAGSVMGVIGRSGAGKSTLIRLVNGLDKPTGGRVLFDGVDVGGLTGRALRQTQRQIGMIFQHFNLLSSRTAFDNVALPLEIAGADTATIAKRVNALLDLVGLADKRDRYPSELSGGQKQRVGIARALATEPKALLSDEATSALDPETTRSILDLLKTVNRELRLTILLITHEMSVVRAIADEVVVLEGGSVVEHSDVYDIFTQPRHAVTHSFFANDAGRQLPEDLKARLQPYAAPGGQTVVRIVFRTASADEAVLSKLTRVLSIDINIISATVDTLAGKPFGWIIASIASSSTSQAIAFFERNGVSTEVLGHVA